MHLARSSIIHQYSILLQKKEQVTITTKPQTQTTLLSQEHWRKQLIDVGGIENVMLLNQDFSFVVDFPHLTKDILKKPHAKRSYGQG